MPKVLCPTCHGSMEPKEYSNKQNGVALEITYECRDCGQTWFLDKVSNIMTKIIGITKMDVNQCSRCGHKWLPRLDKEGKPIKLARTCPSCNSPYWNKERVRK